MSTVERIKKLCEEQKITFAELERRIDLSNGQIARWKKQTPGVDKLEKVAEYFDVSIDFLLGRTEKRYFDLTKKEKTDIGQEVEEMLNGMNTSSEINFYGEPMTDEAKEKLAIALQVALELSKKEAKKKFTPKKYRD